MANPDTTQPIRGENVMHYCIVHCDDVDHLTDEVSSFIHDKGWFPHGNHIEHQDGTFSQQMRKIVTKKEHDEYYYA